MLPALAQPALESNLIYAAPFRERLPSGELGPEYGPRSAAAQAAQTARIRDWSYRAPPRDLRRSKLSALLSAQLSGATLDGLSAREAQVYELVVTQGHSVRFVAKKLGMRRESVKSYLVRVQRKAGL
jgi:DNA-binding CsgD family transcriptional regulator